MTTQDLFITPIYIILLSLIAFILRPLVTTPKTSNYFLPALWVKFFGAILLGLLYQFYYGGGDTINYFNYGSRWIWEAFLVDFEQGISLLLDSGGNSRDPETYSFNSKIWYYRDPKSYAIVRITAVFDLFTFHTYSATSLFFATFSFSGLWALFSKIVARYPHVKVRNIAISILFVPSVIFWGSGILKDTITLGALGWLIWALMNLIEKRIAVKYLIVLWLAAMLILGIKSYILLACVPAAIIWIFVKYSNRIQGKLKLVATPLILAITVGFGFLILRSISSINSDYTIENFSRRAAITAYDIRYGWGARGGGEGGYDIGLPDGSVQSLIRLIPAGINVSIFRPYIWEVRNPLMLLSALESLVVTILFLAALYKRNLRMITKDPFLSFCLVFSLIFAFAVGVSSFNFGTLIRYKIPMTPFLFLFLFIGQYSRKS